MVKIAVFEEITEAEAAAKLREHLANSTVEPHEFERGDIVRLDNGCLGIVSGTDDEGSVTVYFFDDDGTISGPSYGWELTRVDV